MSSEDKYSDFWSEINKRQISTSESLDKALLSLSTAGLGFSLSIAKFVSLKDTDDYFLLYCVWSLFGLTIISTVVSFLISQKALDNVLKYAEEYYLEGIESSLNKEDIWIKSIRWVNVSSVTTFLLAIIFAIIFSIQNFQIKEQGKEIMSEKKSHSTRGTNVPSMPKKQDTSGSGQKAGVPPPHMKPTKPPKKQ